jgi:diketogulonate reductase-like aldo/keto reductase
VTLASLTILYWRDIPTQVVARAGRATAKAELPKRFMEAVDSAAMRAGLFNSDDYLAHWRRGQATPCSDDLDKAVVDAVAALDAAYDAGRLRALIEAGGEEVE